MLADRLAHRAEDHPDLGQFLLEGRDHADAVEDRIDRILGRSDDAGQHLLLAQRDAQLLVGLQDVRIDLVEALDPHLRLGRGVVVAVLIVDLREADLRPVRLIHGQPALERRQSPLQHPRRLVLLGGDETDRVGGQALRRKVLFDVRDKAVLVGLKSGDLFQGLAVGGH